MELKELYDKIRTPEELLGFMDKYIDYGFYGIDEKIYINDGTNEGNKIFQAACLDKYRLADKDRVLKYGYGQCFDQTEMERDWFKCHDYEFKTIFIWFLFDYDNSYPTHSYLVYKDKVANEYCWFEHADSFNRGIHRYNSYVEAIKEQMIKHIEYAKKNGNIVTDHELEHIHVYEYEPSKYDISFDEYIDMILSSKEITDEIMKKYLFNN